MSDCARESGRAEPRHTLEDGSPEPCGPLAEVDALDARFRGKAMKGPGRRRACCALRLTRISHTFELCGGAAERERVLAARGMF